MDQGKSINIQDLIESLIKKWYWVTIPLFSFLILGAWIYVVMPRTYEASTLILVQPQEIPSAYVEATVSSGVEERVRTLSQEVLSRSNLEAIIQEMGLFQEQRREGVSIDILVASMRKRIQVNTVGGRRGELSSFTISFRGRAPREVADVTNRLASYFIDSHLKLRARQATQTTHFLEKQLDELKTLLQEQEAQVEQYRNRYMGELPEQLASNISTISSLQTRLESVQASISDAMNRRLAIQTQLSQIESEQPGATTLSQRGQRAVELRARLEEMRSRYTPEHPEIVRLRQQINELEGQPQEGESPISDPQILELKNQLSTINIELEGLRKDGERLKERIEYYQQRVENTPKREQELAALTRDYNITQQNYQRLLDRLYEAKRAESMELRQQGEQFRVLDYAQPPQVPVSPDRNRIGLVFLALGLGAGAGIVLLFEMLDSTVKGVQQLEKWTDGIPCITAVPLALTKDDKTRRRLVSIFFVALNISIVVVGAGIVFYSKVHNVVYDLPIPLPF
ncbi:MAG: XrtA system polysaccharide chain length determinant [Desulfomonilia bacterium]